MVLPTERHPIEGRSRHRSHCRAQNLCAPEVFWCMSGQCICSCAVRGQAIIYPPIRLLWVPRQAVHCRRAAQVRRLSSAAVSAGPRLLFFCPNTLDRCCREREREKVHRLQEMSGLQQHLHHAACAAACARRPAGDTGSLFTSKLHAGHFSPPLTSLALLWNPLAAHLFCL